VTGGSAVAGFAQMHLDDLRVLFSEGMAVRFHEPGAVRPALSAPAPQHPRAILSQRLLTSLGGLHIITLNIDIFISI